MTPAGKAVQVPIDHFLNHMLPPLRHGSNPSKVLQKLLRTGTKTSAHKPITLRNRWKGFAVDPAAADRTEAKSFAFLENAVQAIHKASGSHQTSVAFQNNPDPVMKSDW